MTAGTNRELWRIAEQVCTPKELQALKLNIAGMGSRRIARALGISPQAVKERLFRAKQKIDLELERRAA